MSDMPRCPKCRKQDYDLTVVCEEPTFSEVRGGKCYFVGASDEPQPVRAYCECINCKHKWQVKNARTAQLNSYEA